jgi:hypothetical protein
METEAASTRRSTRSLVSGLIPSEAHNLAMAFSKNKCCLSVLSDAMDLSFVREGSFLARDPVVDVRESDFFLGMVVMVITSAFSLPGSV